MPFNASGTFQRVHDWTTDRDASIKIRADRMDEEFDGIAQALNDIVGGSVNLSGTMTGVYGTVGAPAWSFKDDADTGMFRVAADTLAFAAGGVERGRFSSTEMQVTGKLHITPQDGTNEGGHILLDGAGSNENWNIDVSGDVLRMFQAGGGPSLKLSSSGFTLDDRPVFHQGEDMTIQNDWVFEAPAMKTEDAGGMPSYLQAPRIKQTVAGNDAAMSFHIHSEYVMYFGLDHTTRDLFTGGASRGVSTKSRIWEQRNCEMISQVAYFARSTAPDGWLKANGALISRTTYASLFSVIGTTYGAGDGSTTFALPDLRGEFVRGLDDGRGVDASRALGSAQTGSVQHHGHYLRHGTDGNWMNYNDSGSLAGFGLEPTATSATGTARLQAGGDSGGTYNIGTAAETRPRNVAMLACIKY